MGYTILYQPQWWDSIIYSTDHWQPLWGALLLSREKKKWPLYRTSYPFLLVAKQSWINNQIYVNALMTLFCYFRWGIVHIWVAIRCRYCLYELATLLTCLQCVIKTLHQFCYSNPLRPLYVTTCHSLYIYHTVFLFFTWYLSLSIDTNQSICGCVFVNIMASQLSRFRNTIFNTIFMMS